MPTRLASSTLVIRPSAWISARILRSISSRFFGTRSGSLRLARRVVACNVSSATLLAPPAGLAQFYCACGAPFGAVPGKIRLFGLQFLHSYPDILDLHLTLLAPSRRV